LHVVAAVLLGAFIVVEARAREPLLPLGRLRSRQFSVAVALHCAIHTVVMGLLILVPFLIEFDMQRPPLVTGALLAAVLAIAMGITLGVRGRAWLQARWLAPAALGLLGAGLGLLGWFGPGLGDPGLALVLAGAGGALTVGTIASAARLQASVPPALAPAAARVVAAAGWLGYALAATLASGVVGLVTEYEAARLAVSRVPVPSVSIVVALASLLVVVLIGLVLAVLTSAPRQPSAAPRRLPTVTR
jgi:hypothetical protein